jgi:hypothetical protein
MEIIIIMTSTTNLQTLVYDKKAYDAFFAGYDKIIDWCMDFGFLDEAQDHVEIRDSIRAAVKKLPSKH